MAAAYLQVYERMLDTPRRRGSSIEVDGRLAAAVAGGS
jgi:hypothetical protein